MLCKVAFCALSHIHNSLQPNNLLHIRTLVLGVGLSLVSIGAQEHHQNMKLNDWLQLSIILYLFGSPSSIFDCP